MLQAMINSSPAMKVQTDNTAARCTGRRTDHWRRTRGLLGRHRAGERGHRVVQVEKSRHPRFHIGESLLPANLPIFERLGVAEQVKAIGMQKWGAEFVSPWHGGRGETFNFAEGLGQIPALCLPGAALGIRRDPDPARRAARSRRWSRAAGYAASSARPMARCASRPKTTTASTASWLARYVIDASGRDTFLGNQLGNKRRNSKHNSAALFGHFRHADRYPEEKRAGNISIYWFEHGWFWFIPLADGVTSIGAVVWPYYLKSRKIPVRDFFLETIAMCPPLAAAAEERGAGL